jgi:hypothetical protein
MLDPGARLRFNLLTSSGYFLLPWKDADVGTVTADAAGHAAGSIPTSDIPPGSYRLSFLCEAGCSALDNIPNVSGVLENGQSYRVALGPAFEVVLNTSATLTAVRSSTNDSLTVQGSGLPPSTTIEVLLLYQLPYGDGRSIAASAQTTVGTDGRISVVIPSADLPPGAHLVYVVAGTDRVIASTSTN